MSDPWTELLLEVESVRVHMRSGRHVLLMREVDGGRILPVWIGQWEAQAIAMKLQGITSERPLTHDLFAATLGALGVTVERVVITSLSAETFHASLVMRSASGRVTVDARPSDAVALAVRLDCPVYAVASVLDQAASLPDPEMGAAGGEDGSDDADADDDDADDDEATDDLTARGDPRGSRAAGAAGAPGAKPLPNEATGEKLDPFKLKVFREFINSLDADQDKRGS